MKKQLLSLSLTALVALSLTNCAAPKSQSAATIIHGSPTGGPIPIYVLATFKDLKAGGLAAGWFRGWSQAEYEFVRLDSSRRICNTGETPTCRRELPIALVAVPKSYLTGEIPGSLALYHVMSGTGDLIGGAGNLLSGIAWFRGIKVNFSGLRWLLPQPVLKAAPATALAVQCPTPAPNPPLTLLPAATITAVESPVVTTVVATTAVESLTWANTRPCTV